MKRMKKSITVTVNETIPELKEQYDERAADAYVRCIVNHTILEEINKLLIALKKRNGIPYE